MGDQGKLPVDQGVMVEEATDILPPLDRSRRIMRFPPALVWIHTYIHTYIHAYIHTYVYTYIRTYMHEYMYTCIHKYIYACVHTHAYVTRRLLYHIPYVI